MNERIQVDQKECPLSDRQREAVYWASMGKTAVETGMIINTSGGAVQMLLQHANEIAGTTTKPSLVAMALRKGWIA